MFINITIIIFQFAIALLTSSMTTIKKNSEYSNLARIILARGEPKTFHRTWHRLLGTFGDFAADRNSAEAICREYIVGKAKDSVIRLLLIYQRAK